MTLTRWFIAKGPPGAEAYLASWRTVPRGYVEWTPHREDAHRFPARSSALAVAERIAEIEGLRGVEVREAADG